MSDPAGAATVDEVPASARRLVAVALALMLTAGLIGFEAWPLTAWRLFSLARDNEQTMWVVRAVEADGTGRNVSLEELPLEYRHAAWPMSELPGASRQRRDDVCLALLGAVVDVVPDVEHVEIVRDRQHLVEEGGEWVATHDPEVVHTCARSGG